MLHRITVDRNALNAHVGDVPATICGQHGGLANGFYFWFFSNDSDEHVWDNNGGREKVVIRKRGRSVRPGKFDMGRTGTRTLLVRVRNYDDHLHHLPHEWPLSPGARVLRRCVDAVWVFALPARTAPTRQAETVWIHESLGFLRDRGWALERARREGRRAGPAEWHHVVATGKWDEDEFEAHLHRVGERLSRELRR